MDTLIGTRIKARRESLGLTFRQVADAADMSPSTLHDLESNPNRRPSAETIYGLAKALECSMEYLLGVPRLPCEIADGENSLAKENHLLRRRLERIAEAVKAAESWNEAVR